MAKNLSTDLSSQTPQYQLDAIPIALNRHGIVFSKTVAAKLVGGEYRLEKLVMSGEIRMDKPTAKQNGKWYCNGGDVIKHTRL